MSPRVNVSILGHEGRVKVGGLRSARDSEGWKLTKQRKEARGQDAERRMCVRRMVEELMLLLLVVTEWLSGWTLKLVEEAPKFWL